tara:strand:- start:1223 stop:1522 length:300 start_codon:yes stop_codon:yes gene_type:complete
MATKYHNITGELTQTLLEEGDNINVSKISLTNIEGTNKCTVDLYIEKNLLGKFYLLKGVELPIDATLTHELYGFNGQFSLNIKLTKSASETPAVDVILQ